MIQSYLQSQTHIFTHDREFVLLTDHEAAMKEKDAAISFLRESARMGDLNLNEQIAALKAELKEQVEQGIAIIHDQGAENILLKEQVASLKAERKVHNRVAAEMLETETKDLTEQIAALKAELKEQCEQGIAIMHDQGAENILLKEALQESVLCPETIQQMMREHGIVISDHGDKMQKFALTLYTVLVNLATIAKVALKQEEVEG